MRLTQAMEMTEAVWADNLSSIDSIDGYAEDICAALLLEINRLNSVQAEHAKQLEAAYREGWDTRHQYNQPPLLPNDIECDFGNSHSCALLHT